MTSIVESVGGLFSFAGLAGFVLGVVATLAYQWGKERLKARRHPDYEPKTFGVRSLTLLWALIFIITGYIGFQQQQTATQVRGLAHDTAECSRQFNAALKARGEISEDSARLARVNDYLSQVQRNALADWFHDILQPPPEILRLRENDPDFGRNPVYVRWSIDITTKYADIMADARAKQVENDKQQAANDAERAKHPYPEPSCGK